VLTSKHKLKSFAFNPVGGQKGNLGQIVLGLSNNSIEVRQPHRGSLPGFAMRHDVITVCKPVRQTPVEGRL
jgi:hypothetical protein